MIEYITQTGIFGILWIISFIVFIGVLISFIKRNGILQTLVKLTPIVIILILLNFFANQLIGQSKFDVVLIFVKDLWFLIGHIIIVSILTFYDKNCLEFLKVLKKRKDEQ